MALVVTRRNRRVRTSASPVGRGVPHGREGNESPRVPLSVAFDQPSKAGAHVGGDFRFRIGRSPEQDVNEAQGFDERRALKQELNPADEQEAAVDVTLFQARQDPRCGFGAGGVASTSVVRGTTACGFQPMC